MTKALKPSLFAGGPTLANGHSIEANPIALLYSKSRWTQWQNSSISSRRETQHRSLLPFRNKPRFNQPHPLKACLQT